MMPRIAAGIAAVLLAGSALADEITLKKEFGGDVIQCQIYKETDEYINYIDIKKDQDAGCARSIVEKVTKSDKPLVDVEAFFLRKAGEAKDKTSADAARAKAEEARKAAEAAGKAAGDKKTGKLTMRPMNETSGVKVVPSHGAGGGSELIVDPFPEEGTPTVKPPANKK
ncbi:MAG TPA: hypothetical protein PK280_12785 [Planctomycetota bacterium]|nr:hypothetical protein [Planctomycetota bacterium]